ncbi:DUF1206 domain-containing protein [Brachybacterium phenoliresistens]|uniref:DUF1206 domain-containing protein n=1 Tax=Brachybacterium phenoliresistens TaxID=396014 RepID=UPI0031E4084A
MIDEGDVEDAARAADDAAQRAADSTWFERASRAGYVANGAVHALLGGLAVGLALGRGGEADQSGAVQILARQPFGLALIWMCLVGCVLLALWNLANAFFGRAPLRGSGSTDPRTSRGRRRWKELLIALGRAVAYAAVASVFVPVVLGGGGDSDRRSAALSTTIASAPGGLVILVVIGLVVVGFGVGFCVQGVRRSWERRLRMPRARPLAAILTVSGVAGYLGKGATLLAVGVLVIVSALAGDPERSTGVDGALRAMRDQPFGPALLLAVGAGLLLHGVFLVLRSRYDRME